MTENNYFQIKTLQFELYQAGYKRLSTEWNYSNLTSPFSRIYLIEDGETTVRHSGKTHVLKKGDLHLVPCHVTADYICPESHTQYYVGFAARLENGFDLFTMCRCKTTLRADERQVAIFKQMISLIKPFDEKRGWFTGVEMPLAINIEIRGLMLQLASAFLQTTRSPTKSEQEREGRLTPILQFIDENQQDDITLEKLASLAGLTPTYFSDLFFKTIGVRPVEYINRCRIERAQRLLASTDMNMQEIADAVGIHSSAYFSRLFHTISGTSPRLYRKMALGLIDAP